MKRKFYELFNSKVEKLGVEKVHIKTGICKTSISKYRNNKVKPDFNTGVKIMQKLKIKADEIELEK